MESLELFNPKTTFPFVNLLTKTVLKEKKNLSSYHYDITLVLKSFFIFQQLQFSTSPVIKKRKPENISSRKYDSSVRDLFSKMGTQSNSSLLTPSTLAINGPNLIRQSQISPGQIGQSTSPNSQDRYML